MILRILLPLALAGVAAAAAAQQSNAGRAAERFRLDMPDAGATPTPAATAPADAATPAATLPPPALPDSTVVTGADGAATDAPRATYTLDTPIHDLIANPATKAVLDKDLPGLSDDENLAKFDRLGLKQFQPLTGGQLTDAMLAKVAKDLVRVGGPSLAVPVKPSGSRGSRRDESR